MITLKDFMQTVEYRVTEGGEYCWSCYGPNAYSLDFWNQDHDGHSISIVFDTRTHEVYEAAVCDYRLDRAYRLINPVYKRAHANEASERDVDLDEAWDDVKYVELEADDDFLEKARAILSGEDYDTRVQIPLNMDKEDLLLLMTLAHERDITFNQLVEIAIKEAIDAHKMLNDVPHATGTDNPIDFPAPKSKKKKHGKK